ncbi:putative F-box domain, leucine-rich repeat domain superfamily, F-box-like domain superfamily [Helianthus anomalus]
MKAKRQTKDTINTLPQTIIENILCFLPIREAARTSILSKEWRYKWTTIPKLKFGSSTLSKGKNKEKLPSDIASARKNMDRRCKLFNAIHQVLLMHQGPIHENHIVKKLTLAFDYIYKLPSCAFSLHHLRDLHLRSVVIDHQPIFSGFGSLRSLCLYYVKISKKDLLHLLSNCPSLKRFNPSDFLEELFLSVNFCFGIWLKRLVLDSIRGELPISLIHLKYFCYNKMDFADYRLFTSLLVLIKCSPNLEKIVLEELEIQYFSNLKHDMEFVKLIMASSPKLKKVIIHSLVEKDEESDMLKILLQAPRASPVEIVVRSMINR